MDDEHSHCVMGPVEEIPFCGSLSSLIFDPLDISADEESPLIQELRTLEGFGTFRHRSGSIPLRGNVEASGPAARRHRVSAARPLLVAASPSKDSHHPTLSHTRALVLRPMPSYGVENRHDIMCRVNRQSKQHARSPSRPDSAMTERTDISLRIGSFQNLGNAGNWETVDEKLQIRTRPALVADAPLLGEQAKHNDSCEKNLHNISQVETSVGPEWSQDFSQELAAGPSSEFLNAGQSFMTDSSDLFDVQHSQDDLGHHCSHHCSNRGPLDRLKGISEGDTFVWLPSFGEGPSAYLSQRSPMVAVIEVPKIEDGVGSDRPKRILQVAPTVPHVCLAFDPLRNERDRQKAAEEVTTLLHPRTRRLVENIHGAGKFPKKKVVRLEKMPPLHLPTGFAYPSGSCSARAEAKGGALWGFSEEDDASKLQEDPGMRNSWFDFFSASNDKSDSLWQPVDQSHAHLQDAGERMKSYFPASARSGAQ